jgi:predicted nucleotidyltransferase
MVDKKHIENIKPKIIDILRKKGVVKAGIFGSYARGEQNENSDVDILIDPPKGMEIEFVGLKIELENSLGKKVDFLTYNGINPHLKKYILKDEVRIL